MDAARAGTDLRDRRYGGDGARALRWAARSGSNRRRTGGALHSAAEKDVLAMLADLKAKRVLET